MIRYPALKGLPADTGQTMGASDSFKPQFHFCLCDSVHFMIQHSLAQREMSQHSKAQYGFALLMQRDRGRELVNALC